MTRRQETQFDILNRGVGPDSPPLVIAEIAQAHDGSLGFAHAFIDASADAGAGMVKFQTHIASQESTRHEPWRVKFSRQDASRFKYWRRIEFSEDQWAELYTHAHARGLLFSSSPFSTAAVEMLSRTGIDAWKIASGQHNDIPMMRAVTADARPVLVSTGMSPWSEIDETVAILRQADISFAMMQCTSIYPTPVEKLGLNVIAQLRERYGAPTGLSDHSATIYAGLAAVSLGADILEVHATFDKRMFGPDTVASITFDELKTLCGGADYIYRARQNAVDKDEMAQELSNMRSIFTKSLVAAKDLPEGAVVTVEDLALKKPGGGLTYDRIDDVLGRRLRAALAKDDILSLDDLD